MYNNSNNNGGNNRQPKKPNYFMVVLAMTLTMGMAYLFYSSAFSSDKTGETKEYTHFLYLIFPFPIFPKYARVLQEFLMP